VREVSAPPPIDRGFVRIAEGLIHYRTAGSATDRPPLWMMHAAPASSKSLESQLLPLAATRRVFAPDTLGYGDSAAPTVADPELTDYADAFLRAMDGLGLQQVDLYGFHTGAHIAIEIAIAAPKRVRRIVLDGLLVLSDAQRNEFLAHYAPVVSPDEQGTQVLWALNYIRDQAWFFPHFKRDAAHNMGLGAMPPEVVHYLTTELLKSLATYHLGYRAVFRHRVVERLQQISCPVLLVADPADPTRESVRIVGAQCPAIRCEMVPPETKTACLLAFLDANRP